MGDENPLTIHEISAAQTPSDWASEPAAAKQAEVYEIKLKCVFPFIQYQCLSSLSFY